ncbi:MAG TPA: hypothetical protein VMB74_10630 [Streptosporangiaceae bacterium]|nr:hypothetical protein [Streptosporangiaceae bacterium]
MIRRGFWLLAGAVLGVTGYRKATRLARTLTGQGLLGGTTITQQRLPAQLVPPRRALPGQLGSGQPVSGQPDARPSPAAAARIAAAAGRATAAAGFVRDIRDGMAEYWDLHRSESDRTLGSQRDRTWSGDS